MQWNRTTSLSSVVVVETIVKLSLSILYIISPDCLFIIQCLIVLGFFSTIYSNLYMKLLKGMLPSAIKLSPSQKLQIFFQKNRWWYYLFLPKWNNSVGYKHEIWKKYNSPSVDILWLYITRDWHSQHKPFEKKKKKSDFPVDRLRHRRRSTQKKERRRNFYGSK